jgi:glyoxylase-like metal-dependent hydrolase (beta-lactamase superfamily II)
MYSKKLSDHIYSIDLKPMGIEDFIASYVLVDNKAMIIETGPTASVGNLLAGLEEIGVEEDEVDYVAVSHVHIDHAGGSGTLLQHLPNARLIAHARGAPHLAKPERLWRGTKQVLGEIAEMYGEFHPVAEDRITKATDGMVVELGDEVRLSVMETLGHASHHLSFYETDSGGIFPGDAAGIYLKSIDVVIPTTPPPFNLEMTLASLSRLIQLMPRRLYYTHFGNRENAVKRLEAYVVKLELWAKVILEGMRNEENSEAIYERILEEDASTRRAADFIKDHLVLRRGVIMQNIQGFTGYLEKTRA